MRFPIIKASQRATLKSIETYLADHTELISQDVRATMIMLNGLTDAGYYVSRTQGDMRLTNAYWEDDCVRFQLSKVILR